MKSWVLSLGGGAHARPWLAAKLEDLAWKWLTLRLVQGADKQSKTFPNDIKAKAISEATATTHNGKDQAAFDSKRPNFTTRGVEHSVKQSETNGDTLRGNRSDLSKINTLKPSTAPIGAAGEVGGGGRIMSEGKLAEMFSDEYDYGIEAAAVATGTPTPAARALNTFTVQSTVAPPGAALLDDDADEIELQRRDASSRSINVYRGADDGRLSRGAEKVNS